MKPRLLASLASAFLVAASLISGPAAPAATAAPDAQASAAQAGFITKSGNDLRKDGVKVRLFGGTLFPTVWQGQYLGGDAFTNPDPAVVKKLDDYIASQFRSAKANGFNTLRLVNFLTSSSDYRNPTAWKHIDNAMTQASYRGMYVILDLSTFRNRLIDAGKTNPYDPALWSGLTSFVTDRYRNRTTLAMYSIAGEVEAPNYGQAPGKPRPSASTLINFFDKVSTQLRNGDQNHLISSGGFIYMDDPNSGIPWQQIFSLPNIQLATIHAYGTDQNGNQVVPVKAYDSVGAWANSRGIPFLVEEFGFPQSVGDTRRSELYGQQYEKCARYIAAMQVFWNYGPEVKGDSFDVNANTPKTLATIKGWAG